MIKHTMPVGRDVTDICAADIWICGAAGFGGEKMQPLALVIDTFIAITIILSRISRMVRTHERLDP
jgi:hypothetical protein